MILKRCRSGTKKIIDERAAGNDDFQKELEERNDAILNFLDAYSKEGDTNG